jgi:hypothetical protein
MPEQPELAGGPHAAGPGPDQARRASPVIGPAARSPAKTSTRRQSVGARSGRGALAGALAAAVWAAQQPLDKRIFSFPFDDVELLGKAVTHGPRWRLVGTAMHLANGAAFGAVYANLQGRAGGLPQWGRGPAAALGEHLASWPATALTDRFHPARAELPVLRKSGRAFAQAAWRHLVFGVVLGELERRFNRRGPG